VSEDKLDNRLTAVNGSRLLKVQPQIFLRELDGLRKLAYRLGRHDFVLGSGDREVLFHFLRKLLHVLAQHVQRPVGRDRGFLRYVRFLLKGLPLPEYIRFGLPPHPRRDSEYPP
jgi:hypothetical protein